MPRRYLTDSELLPETTPNRRYLSPDELEPEEPEYGWMDRAVSTGLRVVPSIVGGLGGAAAGAAAGGVMAPAGLIAGGAAGGGFGEWLAQKYEQARGLRKDTNLGSVAVETALGAIPIAKSATLLKAGLKGAGMGAAGAVGHSYAEEGEMPDLQTLAISGGLGGMFGAGGQAIGDRLTRKGPAAATSAAPESVEFAPDVPPERIHKTWHGPEEPRPGSLRYVDDGDGITSERVPYREPESPPGTERREYQKSEALRRFLGRRGLRDHFAKDAAIRRAERPHAEIVDPSTPVQTLDDYLGGDSPGTREARSELDAAIAKGRAARTAAKGPFPKLDAFGAKPTAQPDDLVEPDPGDLPSSESLLDHLIRRDTNQTLTEMRRELAEYAALPPGLPPAKRTLLEDLLLQDERRTLREMYEDNLATIEEQGLARKPRGPEGGGAPPAAASPQRQLRENRNTAAMERYRQQFDPVTMQAIEEFSRRNPRLFSTITIEGTPAAGRRAEFVPFSESQGERIGQVRLRPAKPGETPEELLQAIEHEARHAVDARKMGPWGFAEQSVAEGVDLPYAQQPMEMAASGLQKRRAAERAEAARLGRPLTGRERVALRTPREELEDLLSTGERQPRLPEAGDVRAREVATPEFDAPYSLTPQVAAREAAEQDLLFGGKLTADEPSVPWQRQRAEEAVAAGFPGTVEEAEADILRRTREPYEASYEAADMPRDVLKRVRDAGGISLSDKALGGEMKWLGEFRQQERGSAGSLGGVKDVLRAKGKGRKPESMAEDLLGKQATGSDLIEMLADATRRGGKGRPAFRPEDYAEPAGIRPGARWWDDAPPFVNDLTPEMVDEPGAAGFMRAELSSTVAGGLAGGAAGATQGDTPEERIQNALIGATAGAGGGYGLTRLLQGRAVGRSTTGAKPQGASPSATILQAAQRAEQAAAATPPVPGRPRTMQTSSGRLRYTNEGEGNTPVIDLPKMAKPYPEQVRQPKAQREDLGLDHFPEEMRGTLQELADQYGLDKLEAQRRGRMPHALQEALSREYVAHGGKKMAPGTNLPSEGHRHLVNTLASVHQRAKDLGAKIAETGGTDAENLELGKLVSAQEVLFYNYIGNRSEAGRALGQYRLQANVLPTNLRVVRDLLNRGRIRKDLAEMSDMLKAIGDDPDGLKTFELFRNKQTRPLSDRIGSYFSANILSGLQTQERNFLGGAARTFGRLASKPVIGGMDALESMFTGKARQVYSSEVLHEGKGFIAGLDGAIKDALDTFKLGYSRNAMLAGWADVDKMYYPKAEFAGGGKNPLNWIGRGMEGADRFWRSLNQSMELHALTYADARRAAEKQGLTGSAYDAFVGRQIAEARANPSKELRRRVNKTAERAVYQEDNALATQINALKHVAPGLHYILPFVKTVANIFKQGIEHTPAGFFMKRARPVFVQDDSFPRAGEPLSHMRDRAIARGEAAMGTLALLPIAYYAATGRMSGSGPRDPAERARLYETGWRPHSVKMPLAAAAATALGASASDDGEYWVSYALAQPFSIPAAIVANGFEAFEEVSANASEKTREQAASDIVSQTLARVGKSALDQSFLSGLGSFVEAINDPERAAEGFFGRTAQGFVPLSGALRNVARVADPVVRQPEGILESFQSNLPGLSQSVPPRLTRYGEPIVREDSSALVVPEVSPVQRDAISDELHRLGVTLATPTDRMAVGRQLTRDESLQVRQTRGRTVRALLSAVMGAPGYENLPDAARSELLQRALEEVKGDVNQLLRAAVQLQRPDLLQQVSQSTAAAAQQTYR